MRAQEMDLIEFKRFIALVALEHYQGDGFIMHVMCNGNRVYLYDNKLRVFHRDNIGYGGYTLSFEQIKRILVTCGKIVLYIGKDFLEFHY